MSSPGCEIRPFRGVGKDICLIPVARLSCPQIISMKRPDQSHLVIVGAGRDIERTVVRQVRVFDRAFARFRQISYVIVESDSSDRTVAILDELKNSKPGFHYVSLGKLQPEFPLRTQRLVRARNAAIEFCAANPVLSKVDYVAVADWDGVSFQLTEKAILSCWNHEGWDIATANQPEEYYDVWALRHPTWCPGDCWEECRRLERELGSEVAHQIAVSSKRIKIPETHNPIEVESAFGGLAVYRSEVFFQSRYKTPDSGEGEVCEHVAFHAAMRARGARIIINPALVNTFSLYETLPLFSWQRLLHTAQRRLRFGRKTIPAATKKALASEPLAV